MLKNSFRKFLKALIQTIGDSKVSETFLNVWIKCCNHGFLEVGCDAYDVGRKLKWHHGW